MRLRRLCFALAAMAAAITLTGCPGNDPAPRPANVTLTPATGTVGAGGMFLFVHAVLPAGVSQTVTWSFTPPTAGVTLVDGLLQVGLTVPVDTVLTVRATAAGHDGVFAEATVTVTAVTPTGVTLTPTSHSFTAGVPGSQQFNHTVLPIGASQAVIWSFTPYPTAGVTLEDGLLTVTANAPATTLTVRATAAGHDGVFAQATVNLAAPAPESVTVAPADGVTVVAGVDLPFAATVLPAQAAGEVSWEVRNPDDEDADDAISEDGVFNVPADGTLGGLGIWTVRAVVTPSVYSEWVNVTVTAPPPTGISPVSPNPAAITMPFGADGTGQFSAETVPSLAGGTITWSVAPTTPGVEIDSEGYLTIAAGTDVDSLTVTARVQGTAFYSEAAVTVVPPTGGVFTVDFAELVDRAAGMDIEGLEISLAGGGRIEVTNPAGNISWLFGGTSINNVDFEGSVTGEYGETLYLSTETLGELGIRTGRHFVTAIVVYGGMPYSRRIAITVVP